MVGVAAIALVAHISVLDGHALVRRGEGGQIAALRNEPVLTGDEVATGKNADAEIALGPSLFLRLDANSAVQIVSLVPHHRDVRLLYGTLAVSAQPDGDSPRVDTPSLTLAPDAPGLFRITVAAGQTSVVALRGTIRLVTPNGMQVLGAGELVNANGDPSAPTLSYGTPPPNGAFHAFNETRDAAVLDAARVPYLPAELERTTNLSAYGTWVAISGKRTAWRPAEPRGWSPYAQGRWLYRASIGWTWIAHESWGWIPYHYGAWTYDAKNGWVWVPPSVKQPVHWTAANAVFFGVVVRGHTQQIGWIALAPGEPFHAALRDYRNAGAPGGMHVIDVRHFYWGDFSGVQAPALAALPQARPQAPRPPATTAPRRPR
jgi:hypothetical protein